MIVRSCRDPDAQSNSAHGPLVQRSAELGKAIRRAALSTSGPNRQLGFLRATPKSGLLLSRRWRSRLANGNVAHTEHRQKHCQHGAVIQIPGTPPADEHGYDRRDAGVKNPALLPTGRKTAYCQDKVAQCPPDHPHQSQHGWYAALGCILNVVVFQMAVIFSRARTRLARRQVVLELP